VVRIPKGERRHGGPSRRWKNNKIDHKEIGWESVEWIRLARVRIEWWALVNTVTILRVP
jgi:hypothetical protein